MTTAIWWIRRDFRLTDNPALTAALDHADQIVPLFNLDPTLLDEHKASRQLCTFMFEGLRQLDAVLNQKGGTLIVRLGDPKEVLPAVYKEVGATAVFAQADTHPYARARDLAVGEQLPLYVTEGTLIRPAGSIEKKSGGPYTVFTPFKKTWLGQALPRDADLLPAPDRISVPIGLESVDLSQLESQPSDTRFPSGEAEARNRFEEWVTSGLRHYDQKRDFMAVRDGTSSLSPYLRFGMISPREAAVRALEVKATDRNQLSRESADTWLSELIWRDFYSQIEYHFPYVHDGNFNASYNGIEWRNDPAEFDAWCRGETGYPVVDAAMRQLNQTGWMHNRARMIVASFLVKDLLIDWRWGEKYFQDRLVDHDPAANNGGWQWAAGTGTDAAPYFRIFNPVSQSQKFDAKGEYVRRFVPELAKLTDKQIHAPWQVSPLELRMAGITLDQTYPAPIVDHKMARQRTLDAYKAARERNAA